MAAARTARRDAPARSAATAPRVDRFDSGRAFAELRRQVELGPRPAGSDALRAARACGCGASCRAGASSACPATRGCATSSAGSRARSPRSRSPRTTTRRTCRASSAPTTAPPGTAAVLELARALRRHGPARAARPSCASCCSTARRRRDDARPFRETGLRGSTAYAERHEGEIGALILLDFIAADGPQHPARAQLRPRALGAAARGGRAASAPARRSRPAASAAR